MRYFYEPVPEYMTRGVAENVHGYLILQCIEMLASMKAQKIEPDYLQVYELSYDEQEKRFSIRHSQEQPDYENTVSFALPFGVKPYECKIYYIDDGDHRTFLLAEEY